MNQSPIDLLINIASEGTIDKVDKRNGRVTFSGKLIGHPDNNTSLVKSEQDFLVANFIKKGDKVLFLDLQISQDGNCWIAGQVLRYDKTTAQFIADVASALKKIACSQDEYLLSKTLEEREREIDQKTVEIENTLQSLIEREASVMKREADSAIAEARLAKANIKYDEASQSLIEAKALQEDAAWVSKYLPQRAIPTGYSEPGDALTPANWDTLVANLVDSGLDKALAQAFMLSTFVALKNRRFLLLAGHVGVGKSSLVSRAAKAIEGETRFIAVRPGWLDPSDLLGFVDSRGQFIQGPLTETLTRPGKAERVLYLLLDEMNIGRVENYASDLLAVLGSDEEMLELPGLSITESIITVALKGAYQELKSVFSLEEQSKLERLFEASKSCHVRRLSLGATTVFCGTLNVDETTEKLSPKTIDRSFLFRFPKASFESQPHEVSSTIAISTNSVLKMQAKPCDRWQHYLETLKPFEMCLLPISYRVKQDYDLFLEIGTMVGCNPEDLERLFSFSRIFPRIRYARSIAQAHVTSALTAWLDSVAQEGAIIQAVEELRRVVNGVDHYIDYQNTCG